MRIQIVSMTLITVGLIAGSANVAQAADEPNNVFRFGAAYVVPDGEASLTNGDSLNAEDELGYFIDYERRLLPWLGLDFEVLYATPEFEILDPAGTPSVAPQSVEVWTGNLGLNFHFFGRSRFDLYLGVFGGYTDFGSDDPDFNLDGTYNYGGVLGFDIGLTKNGLVLVTSVRYSETDADSTVDPAISVPYNPLVYQLGLGWRF